MLDFSSDNTIINLSAGRRIFYRQNSPLVCESEPNRLLADRRKRAFLSEGEMETKKCRKCNKEKPFTEFHRCKNGARDGLHSWCKQCINGRKRWEYNEQWRKRSKFYQRKDVKLMRRTRAWVWRKIIKKQPCLICGDYAEAHHPDYTNPFNVVWLCRKHHLATHGKKPIATELEENATLNST